MTQEDIDLVRLALSVYHTRTVYPGCVEAFERIIQEKETPKKYRIGDDIFGTSPSMFNPIFERKQMTALTTELFESAPTVQEVMKSVMDDVQRRAENGTVAQENMPPYKDMQVSLNWINESTKALLDAKSALFEIDDEILKIHETIRTVLQSCLSKTCEKHTQQNLPTRDERQVALDALGRMANMVLSDKDNVIKTDEEDIIRAALKSPCDNAIEQIYFVCWEENGVRLKTRHGEFIVTTPKQSTRFHVITGLDEAISFMDDLHVPYAGNMDTIMKAARAYAELQKVV